MIDDYHEAIELIDKMKHCLPIAAYPSKEFVSLLKRQQIKLKTHQRLEIIDVHYFGDEGGISCAVRFPFNTEAQYVISLTHLRPLPKHPLAKEIRRYQLHRVKNLAHQ